LNFYGYVDGDPVNWIDPTGLWPMDASHLPDTSDWPAEQRHAGMAIGGAAMLLASAPGVYAIGGVRPGANLALFWYGPGGRSAAMSAEIAFRAQPISTKICGEIAMNTVRNPRWATTIRYLEGSERVVAMTLGERIGLSGLLNFQTTWSQGLTPAARIFIRGLALISAGAGAGSNHQPVPEQE
jgi:hypothetical protein